MNYRFLNLVNKSRGFIDQYLSTRPGTKTNKLVTWIIINMYSAATRINQPYTNGGVSRRIPLEDGPRSKSVLRPSVLRPSVKG